VGNNRIGKPNGFLYILVQDIKIGVGLLELMKCLA